MLTRDALPAQLRDAYEHLYDLVHLRTHPLGELVPGGAALSFKERAWALHHLLIDFLGELDPGPQAPAYSYEWRRHRLLVLRYEEGLSPDAVADRLKIGRRTFYRDLGEALDAAAQLLWEDYGGREAEATEPAAQAPEHTPTNRLELLRLEAARMAAASRRARVAEVVQGSLPIVAELARARGITVEAKVAACPDVLIDSSVLRQVLLGALSYLLECLEGGCIRLRVDPGEGQALLSLQVRGRRTPRASDDAERRSRLAVLEALATGQNAQLHSTVEKGVVSELSLAMPTEEARLVLVADDNEDQRRLFESYLTQHGYRMLSARNGNEALELARSAQPSAITLDLMMPEKDGWDALQLLTTRSETRHIPVIVCTVLNARQLALSLGAAVFLEKPVSEQALLSTLQALA